MTSGINEHNGHQFEPELTRIYRQHITAFADALAEESLTGDEPTPGRLRRRNTVVLNWDPHAT